jgi:hypothetical protein
MIAFAKAYAKYKKLKDHHAEELVSFAKVSVRNIFGTHRNILWYAEHPK